MNEEPSGVGPVQRGVRPVAYVQRMGSFQGVPHYGCLLTIEAERRMKVNDPLYGQAELNAAVAAERERAARVCDDEARIRTEAGEKHPEDSIERARCFAAARAAINCAKGIRSGEVVGPNVLWGATHCATIGPLRNKIASLSTGKWLSHLSFSLILLDFYTVLN